MLNSCLFDYLSVCLSVCLSVRLPVYYVHLVIPRDSPNLCVCISTPVPVKHPCSKIPGHPFSPNLLSSPYFSLPFPSPPIYTISFLFLFHLFLFYSLPFSFSFVSFPSFPISLHTTGNNIKMRYLVFLQQIQVTTITKTSKNTAPATAAIKTTESSKISLLVGANRLEVLSVTS